MRLMIVSMLLILGSIPTLVAGDTTVGGAKFPESVTLGDQTLLLTGVGLRKKLFIKVYAGALYAAKPSNQADELIAAGGNKSMRMYIIHKNISAKKIRDAWTEGLQNNLIAEKFTAIEARLEEFNQLFPDLHKNDVIEMNFQPGTGTEVVLNGKSRGSVEGDDFFSALLLVWIGDKPADANLKKGILGQ
jgi:hypothetical protein